ncbi:unnamed protein product [Mycena citricolor]|uniref:Uncharacterized protein n=1 Tax=Mycena citricolor TaxID=2018698 RepID=A0AAD2HHY9_9AGAR|nr:unnamed protein product [Mycena citricolor]
MTGGGPSSTWGSPSGTCSGPAVVQVWPRGTPAGPTCPAANLCDPSRAPLSPIWFLLLRSFAESQFFHGANNQGKIKGIIYGMTTCSGIFRVGRGRRKFPGSCSSTDPRKLRPT